MTLPTDVKELIPEFYSSDHMFLVNGEGVDFGERTSGMPQLLQKGNVWHDMAFEVLVYYNREHSPTLSGQK